MKNPRAVPPNVPRDVREWQRPPGTPPVTGDGYGVQSGSEALPLARSLMVPPPWMFPPGEAARYAFGNDDVNLGAGPVAQTVLAGTVFQVPTQNVMVIRELTFSANNTLITSDITFRLRINGVAVEGYTIKLFPRAAASVSSTFTSDSTVVHVPESSVVDITVQVADAGAYQVGANWRGWFYSKDTHERFKFYG